MSTGRPFFNFNIQNLYNLICTYLNNPILHRIETNTYGIKIKTLSRQTLMIICKLKGSFSEKEQIPLKELYWNSFQIRSVMLSKEDSTLKIPSIDLQFNSDLSLKNSLSNIKILNQKNIVGYSEFSIYIINNESSSPIHNLYQALKSENALIYLN